MKKNIVISVVTLVFCFLIGYAAVQTAYLVRNWVTESLSDCKTGRSSDCIDKAEASEGDLGRR